MQVEETIPTFTAFRASSVSLSRSGSPGLGPQPPGINFKSPRNSTSVSAVVNVNIDRAIRFERKKLRAIADTEIERGNTKRKEAFCR